MKFIRDLARKLAEREAQITAWSIDDSEGLGELMLGVRVTIAYRLSDAEAAMLHIIDEGGAIETHPEEEA